ncbi:hypothetical protein [Umezawaea sp. Da 62-37]|uniref:hypothetical protein n=1 Tax=Umezawaea sp. Da 62-37 TaxID=3075927 RepID=UPI0028F6F210|nr:hypothetical protein [Umezawaea sp. Da 62-37]WNV86342.1 hypothetical protein RM788_50905 [Umezawaea sp. Da 62-37]
MTTSARRLLRTLDPLPFGARQKALSDTARRLAGTAELDDLLRDFAGDVHSRRIALQMAYVAGNGEYVAECLAAPETAVVAHALGAAVRLGLPAEVFVERLPHLPTALRRILYNGVRRRRATALADALLPVVRERFGDQEAAALLAACSTPVVAKALPELAHAVANWSAIGRRHPAEFLDLVDAELAAMTPAWWPKVLTRLGGGIAAAAEPEPARVLDLVERTLPHAPLPWGLVGVLGVLARHSPERVAAVLLDPRRTGSTPDQRSLWRTLTGIGDDGLIGIARLLDGAALVRFLHVLAPSRRAAVYAGAVGGRADVPLEAVDELPAAARAAEARRLLALRANADEPSRRLAVTARLGWVEARPVLREATTRATADERATAYPLYIAAGAAGRDQEVFAEVLSTLTRLPNEQDPVRAAALTALAAVPSWLFRTSETDQLVKLMVDAAQARDCSWSTQHAVGTLARALVREGIVSRRTELLDAGLVGLGSLGSHLRWMDLSGLDRALPRGAEQQVFETLRGRMAIDAERGRYEMLLGFADGLGKRAWDMTHLQELLARACKAKDDSVVSRAVGLWLAPPATRDDRVEKVFRGDRSTVTLHPVLNAIGFRRTDLLDDVIGKPLHGRFLKRGVRYVPPFEGCFPRWLPRQTAAYAGELAALAGDRRANVYERANAVRALGRVPGTVDAVRGFTGDREVQVAEAALGALAWTDEPGDVLPDLLSQVDTDRARVAVYAVTRCARFTAPDRLGEQLGLLLGGPKVTARKEAVRLLAEHHVPGAAALLTAAWDGPHSHRDVRRALVWAAGWFLDDEAAWDLLARAAADEQAVAVTVLDRSPFTVAPHHRARYAALVRDVVASPHGDPAVLRAGTVPLWARFDTGTIALLVDRVSDLGNTATWAPALTALLDVCAAANDVEPLREATARLLAAEDLFDAEADRDLPARQRIGALARMVVDRPSAVLRAAAGALSDDLAATPEHRGSAVALAVAAIPWDDDPLPGLRAVTGLADRPALAGRAEAELTARLDGAVRRMPRERALAVAGTLAGEGATAARLALAITAAAGRDTGWPEHWRSLLRSLRRHEDPDVRLAALDTVTAVE